MRIRGHSISFALASFAAFTGLAAHAAGSRESSQVAAPESQILVLSGGGSPATNSVSLYLQTKTLVDSLRTSHPETSLTVMFGAGNTPDRPSPLADVHQTLRGPNNVLMDVMIPGPISGNSSAIKGNVLGYFTSAYQPSKTLFLFVSDHGMPNRDENGEADKTYSNNCIELWGFEPNNRRQPGYRNFDFEDRCLSKDELHGAYMKSVDNRTAPGRIVFAMSQCFSGGFHQLSVNQAERYPTAQKNVCGFTAVTEDEIASGCTADVDGPTYQGYERFFTQQLTGIDVVTGQRLRPARATIEEAHREATIEDMTVDIPMATSDYFLWKWFEKITTSGFTPRTKTISADKARQIAFQRNLLGAAHLSSKPYASKEQFFARVREAVVKTYPEYRSLLNGDLVSLMKLQTSLEAKVKDLKSGLYDLSSDRRAKLGQIYAAWSKFVEAGKSPLTPFESNLETSLFYFYDLDLGFGMGDRAALLSMSLRAISDPEGYAAIASYKSRRQSEALKWALNSGNKMLQQLARGTSELNMAIDQHDELLLKTSKRNNLVRRLVIYRQALGAWNSLAAMDDKAALADIEGLLACEKTAL